ncbi:hypothetical protein L1987_10648 [Smallanthus sonchifolius]|uniref:Uncharacterized protein n=1 Tax=Smallanthus sonchifolius TaxID=185202 RepID=A0ACB9J8M1_9ASTR|nr:hypothetical protein L1987_10648 [Smallanthus sonchifolius]
MASASIFLASQILSSLILFHLLLASSIPTAGFQAPIRSLPATHTFNNGAAASSLIKSSVKPHKDVYLMRLAIGTPPVEILAMVDTGSDLIWTKCKPSGTKYDSSKSKSYSKVDKSCQDLGLGQDCKQRYQDGNSVNVRLGQETLTIGNDKIQNVTFACGEPNKNSKWDGIVGMGRGELSLVSQLKERVFLYCLGSRFFHKTSSVLLAGPRASLEKANTQTMPLLQREGKSYYYLSLEGISVGETKLAVTKSDFAIINGYGGMIIDSGTTFTYLEKRIVDMISDAFMSQTRLEKYMVDDKPYKGLEHCFKPPADLKLKLVFHFEGANWELPKENYIYQKDDVACLAFIAKDDDVSIFGNMQQQNMMVIYDLDNNSLSFKPANCNQL